MQPNQGKVYAYHTQAEVQVWVCAPGDANRVKIYELALLQKLFPDDQLIIGQTNDGVIFVYAEGTGPHAKFNAFMNEHPIFSQRRIFL